MKTPKLSWKIVHGPGCIFYPCDECKKKKEVPILEEWINEHIAINKKIGLDTNLISDGYHTFGELYDHRIRLFITLCRIYGEGAGSMNVWIDLIRDGYFLMGIGTKKGLQISYHLPERYFAECDEIAVRFPPEWDGHTSDDVLDRLKRL